MTLSTAFATYLAGPPRAGAGALADELAAAGLSTAAGLLRSWAHGESEAVLADWPGQRCSIGARLPAGAAAGELWFDVGELSLMLLVPRPADELAELPPQVRDRLTPFVSWLAVAPVAAWQVRGWAGAVGRADPVAAEAPDDQAVTGLRGLDAAAYAGYFGKAMATADDWHAVVKAVGGALLDRLWPGDEPELAGYVEEGVVRVFARDLAPVDAEDDEPADDELEDEATPLKGVRVRTHVATQLGLFDSAPATGRWPRDV